MAQTIPLNIVTDLAQPQERRDAVENRARILATAEQLFASHGVAEVNMANIADAAGVGKGTLYRRFANKGALCLALMDEQLKQFQNQTIAQLQAMTAADEPKLVQLGYFLDWLVYFTEVHIPLLLEVQREGIESDDRSGAPHFWQYLTVHGLLQAAVANAELPATLDLPFLADLLLAPLHAHFYSFQRRARRFPPERISVGLRALLAGLAQSASNDQ